MAARTATAFRRARDGPTEGLADPVLLDASRSAGSTTRRDLRWEGGGWRVIVSHRFLYDARAAWTPSTEVKTEVHRPNDHEVKKTNDTKSEGSRPKTHQAVAPDRAARAPEPAFIASVRYNGPLTGFTRALKATHATLRHR